MRPRAPLTSRLLLTNQCHSQVCSSFGICMLVHLYASILYVRVFYYHFFSKESLRGRLVNWVEKANFEKIQKLLEISERKRHHEILLTAKNLCELSHSLSPYIIPVIPCPLPIEIVKGEHYVIVDLLNLAPGISSPAKTSETETVGRELVTSTQFGQPSLAREDFGLISQASKEDDMGSRFERLPFANKGSRPTPQASKKVKQVPEQLKTPGARVEDFVPWVP